jgi:hypothetical protein
MMEPADLQDGDDPATWHEFDDSWLGTVVVKRLVWPRGVVMGEIRAQDAAEMGLAQNDDVIEALAADGADDPFDERVLPGCPRGNDHLSNPHVGDGPGEALAIAGITISEQISRSGLVRDGLKDLATPEPVHQPTEAFDPIRALSRRNCRGLIVRAWAPAAAVIFPATANCTRPGRRAALRLIVTVSHVSMRGHFY